MEGGRSAERCGGTQRGGERRRQGREREREREGEAVPARARAWMKPASTTRSEARAVIWRGVDCELVHVPEQEFKNENRSHLLLAAALPFPAIAQTNTHTGKEGANVTSNVTFAKNG